MSKQHNNFKKDLDLLGEAYGSMLDGAHIMQGMGVADQAAHHMRDEDGEDKTGHLSDKDIVAKAKQMGTASSWLIDAAEKHLNTGGSLTPRERDDFARDVEGHAEQDLGREHEEDESWKPDSYEEKEDKEAEKATKGAFIPGRAAH